MKLADFFPYIRFLLSYMFGINKIAENYKTQARRSVEETWNILNRARDGNTKKKFIQILSLMALYDRREYEWRYSMAHFYGTSLYTKANKQYVSCNKK